MYHIRQISGLLMAFLSSPWHMNVCYCEVFFLRINFLEILPLCKVGQSSLKYNVDKKAKKKKKKIHFQSILLVKDRFT